VGRYSVFFFPSDGFGMQVDLSFLEGRREGVVVEPGGVTHVEIRFETGTVSGSVMDDQTGKPIPNASIDLLTVDPSDPEEWGYSGDASTDASGRFRIEHVVAGSTRVHVNTSEHLPYWGPAFEHVARGETEAPEVRLKRGATLRILAHLPPSPARFRTLNVLLEGPGAPDFSGISRFVDPDTSTATWPSLPEGTFRVTIGSARYQAVVVEGVELRSGEATELEVTIRHR